MGKSFDLMIIANSANRAALTAVPLVAGERAFTASTTPVGVIAKYNGYISAAMVVSETAAALDVRFNVGDDGSWNRPTDICRLQTVQPESRYFAPLGYPIKAGEVITAEILNAGAVLDAVGLFIDKGAGIPSPIPPPAASLKGYMLVRGVATMTMIADTLTIGTVVFQNYVLDSKKKYHIAGMAADGATGHYTRIFHTSVENADDHPGVPCSDTAAGLDHYMLYGDFGTFDGLAGLQIEQLSNAADATVQCTFLIKEN